MMRLKVMPLVSDFGEVISHPIGVLNPLTQLVFTRDYRIFEQFSNFPGNTVRKGHIKTMASPSPLTIAVVHEDEELATEYVPVDGKSENMFMTEAGQLKALDIPQDTTLNNKAIKAFIDQLDDETPVILCWV